MFRARIGAAVRTLLPVGVLRRLQLEQQRVTRWPPVGWIRFGSLRRLTPVSRQWGSDRGLPLDRYYIEGFLGTQALDIRGHVLEIKDDSYTQRFGGGVLLATLPGISQRNRAMERWDDYWRFTTVSSRRLLAESFPREQLTVKGYGNVLVATAFLYGLATEELRQDELDQHDPDYEVLIAARAVKPEAVV